MQCPSPAFFFFFNDTATTEIYTLSLHDALPIWVDYSWRYEGKWNHLAVEIAGEPAVAAPGSLEEFITEHYWGYTRQRSEEHTSELQSQSNLVCRLLLEKKK